MSNLTLNFLESNSKKQVKFDEKIKVFEAVFIASIHFYFYGIAVSIRKSRHTLDK